MCYLKWKVGNKSEHQCWIPGIYGVVCCYNYLRRMVYLINVFVCMYTGMLWMQKLSPLGTLNCSPVLALDQMDKRLITHTFSETGATARQDA